MHEILPYVIALTGISCGIYTFYKSARVKKDRVLLIDFYLLGSVNIYVGIIYCLVIIGYIQASPSAELSIFMRPANLLLLLIPTLISWRMGL